MANEFINFEKISRKTWQHLHQESQPPLNENELKNTTLKTKQGN